MRVFHRKQFVCARIEFISRARVTVCVVVVERRHILNVYLNDNSVFLTRIDNFRFTYAYEFDVGFFYFALRVWRIHVYLYDFLTGNRTVVFHFYFNKNSLFVSYERICYFGFCRGILVHADNLLIESRIT